MGMKAHLSCNKKTTKMNEINIEDLRIGTELKVNNFLTTDPFNKRGEYGKVIEIDQHYEDITLEFEDGTKGKYELSALEF